VYGATKLAQEHLLTAWCAATGSALSVLRLQNVYGPGQSLTNAYTGIVSLFGQLARRGEVLDVYEDGRITRDFVFIEDVADALVACLDRPPAADLTLDVGSGTATTILDLATTLAGRFGAPTPKVSGKFRHGDVRAGYADITVTGQELGYRPAWPLARGLDALLEWMEHQPDAVAPGARADATTATTWREVTP
jgi:dTDP-L-rhamnose 4-epimerase